MIKTDDEFAKQWGSLGPVYGKQWRSWSAGALEDKHGLGNIDQIQNLIRDLKTNPDSRRLMVNAWNVGELDQMTLPPCHYGFQCYVREGKYLSLMWNQRSVDTFLGLPFNIASYGLLLTILAKEVNMIPDQLIGNLGDTHLYLNHIEQAKEQIGREPFELPTLNQFPTYEGSRPSIESYVVSDFTLKDYQSHPSIKALLSN
jgi:thymidylate synthase